MENHDMRKSTIRTELANPFRVETPVYTDAWMRGDRYGVVSHTVEEPGCPRLYIVRLDKSDRRKMFIAEDCTRLD